MHYADMMAKIAGGDGFIAALDQSGGSTPKALKGYGVEEGAWASDEEMFGLIHDMRCRIIRSGTFSGEKVIGAILFERTMNGDVDGMPVPTALIERGVDKWPKSMIAKAPVSAPPLSPHIPNYFFFQNGFDSDFFFKSIVVLQERHQ